MKTLTYIIIPYLLLTSLNANSTTTNNTLKYNIALNQYIDKQYEKSYNSFYKLFKVTTNDPNINFYLGRSAFEIKKYDEANLAYDRILFEKPNNIRAKLEKARTYFVQKKYKKSKYYFTDLKKSNQLPQSVLNNINNYLNKIEKHLQYYSLNGTLILGIGYDTNINNSASIEALQTATSLPITDNKQNNALAHQEIFVLNYNYKLKKNKTFKTNLTLLNKMMFESKYKEKDMKLVSLTPTLQLFHNKDFNSNYGIFINNLWLDNTNYLQVYGLDIKLNYKINKQHSIYAQLKHQEKNFTIKKDFNSYTNELKIYHHNIYSNKMILNSYLNISNERKNNRNTEVINKDIVGLYLDTNYIYKSNIIISPAILFENINYKDTNVIYNKKPNDKKITLSFNATYIYNNTNIIQSNISYKTQTSNIPINEYDKYIFNINYIRSF
jgi:hypothetical protein